MATTGLKALLLDLDDTLLGNPMETFIPAYFRALTDFVTEIQPPQRLIDQLLFATRTMDRNDGSGSSNAEVFAEAFFPGLGVDREVIEPVFERFYAEAFAGLKPLTRAREAAPRLVDWAFGRGFQVVIATNPMFPQSAIEQRLEWAGVGVGEYDYDHVSCYENSHATKSHPAYYREILDVLGRLPGECLMVGDNWDWDILRSREVGIPGYWIAGPTDPSPDNSVSIVGQGSLDDMLESVLDGGLEEAFEGLSRRSGV